jgi:serine/threonine protein kinase
MKLSQLRSVVQQYNNRNVMQFLSREPAEVAGIQAYVKSFSDVDDRTLTYPETFELVRLLPPQSDQLLILAIKGCLHNNPIFKILEEETEENDKKNALAALYQYGLLYQDTVYSVENTPTFSKLVEVLAKCLLIGEEGGLISATACGATDLDTIWVIVDYLDRAQLLESHLIYHCLNIAPQRSIVPFLGKLTELQFYINKTQLETIMGMSNNKLQRVWGAIYRYQKNQVGALNQDILDKIIQHFSTKIPVIAESQFIESLPANPKERAKIVVNDSNTLFLSRAYLAESPCAKIKKVYATAKDPAPLYSFKKIVRPFPLPIAQQAKKETRINSLLGRKSFYSDGSVLTEWHSGRCLTLYNVKKLKQASLKSRLICVADGIKQLETLHVNNIVHGDIKPDNFILDLENNTLKLIDFSGVHQQGSTKNFAYTEDYMEGNSRDYVPNQYGVDIYLVGIAAAYIFPELYDAVDVGGKRRIQLSSNVTSLTPVQRAIVILVGAMQCPVMEERCTSKDALLYCQKLIENFDHLTHDKLTHITQETLERELTLEHAIRGKMRVR